MAHRQGDSFCEGDCPPIRLQNHTIRQLTPCFPTEGMPKIICNTPTEQGVNDEIVSSELRATVDNEDEDENYDESIGTLKRPGEDKPKAKESASISCCCGYNSFARRSFYRWRCRKNRGVFSTFWCTCTWCGFTSRLVGSCEDPNRTGRRREVGCWRRSFDTRSLPTASIGRKWPPRDFRKNTVFRKCGTPSPMGGGGGGSGPTSMKPGDWLCFSCGDHQFSKNTSCRKCGAPNPMNMMDGMGFGMGGMSGMGGKGNGMGIPSPLCYLALSGRGVRPALT